jgi:raffinose/stachyose/melibiose transport system substrate-binding protein
MKKKMVLFLVMIVSISMILSAAGQNESSTAVSKTLLTVRVPMPTQETSPSEKTPRVVVTPYAIRDLFIEKNPDIEVEFDFTEGEDAAMFQARIAAGTAPDVDHQHSSGWQFGYYLPMDAYLAEPNPYYPQAATWKDMFYPTIWQDFTSANACLRPDGVVTGIPLVQSPGEIVLLYYNKNLLQELGIAVAPKTIEEFTAACETAIAAGYYGFMPPTWMNSLGGIGWWGLEFGQGNSLMMNLFDEIDANKDGVVTEEEKAKALISGMFDPDKNDWILDVHSVEKRKLTELAIPGWTSLKDDTLWRQGKVLFTEHVPTLINDWGSDPNITFEIGMTPYPVATSKTIEGLQDLEWTRQGPVRATPGDAVARIIAPSVKIHGNIDAAVNWVQFITTPEILNPYLEETGWVGAVKGSSIPEVYREYLSQPFPKRTYLMFPHVLDNQSFDEFKKIGQLWYKDQMSDTEYVDTLYDVLINGATRMLKALESQK